MSCDARAEFRLKIKEEDLGGFMSHVMAETGAACSVDANFFGDDNHKINLSCGRMCLKEKIGLLKGGDAVEVIGCQKDI